MESAYERRAVPRVPDSSDPETEKSAPTLIMAPPKRPSRVAPTRTSGIAD